MNKKIYSLILASTLMFQGSVIFAEDNEQVWKAANDWAVETLEYAKELSVYPECFNKADLTVNVTRAEFAEISVGVYEAITGKSAKGTQNPFVDSNNSYVMSAYQLGIIEGISDTLFAPLDEITREAAAAMLNRTYGICVTEEATDSISQDKFSDDKDISEWAYEDVYSMTGKGYIRGTGNGFEPHSYCTREQALMIAARLVSNVKGLGNIGETDKEDKDDYVIVYIGGSLTEGGANWRNKVTEYVKKQMPDKNVVAYSAGIGGTCSDYGALRYAENVLSKNPDLVFMDSAVNDSIWGTSNEIKHQKYVESMIRQSLRAEKVPAVVFLYMPYPGEKTSDEYKSRKFSADAKEKLAKHYNISSVYINDYLFEKYDEEGGTDYMDWLGQYYNKEGNGYNVHPKSAGYSLYGDAILSAFEKNGFENFIKPIEDTGIFCTSEKELLNSSYSYIKANDERAETDGKWKIYKSVKDYSGSGDVPAEKYYSYPYFEEGIWHTTDKGASLSFSTNASSIYISYISYTAGNSATVYVDGKIAGEVNTQSQYNNMNYITNINISKDGKTHQVKITANEFGKSLDIGAVIEEFGK